VATAPQRNEPGTPVIAHPERHVKMEFTSYHLLPDVAVLDPRMTVSLPPRMTASTGVDTLVHAIEGYTCIQKNPLSDAYAWAAIELIRDQLPRAVANGKDVEAPVLKQLGGSGRRRRHQDGAVAGRHAVLLDVARCALAEGPRGLLGRSAEGAGGLA